MCPIVGMRYHLKGANFDLCKRVYDLLDSEDKETEYEAIPPPADGYGDPITGEHPDIVCDESGMCPIVGLRYHLKMQLYDLCQAEYDKLDDDEKAAFRVVRPPYAAHDDEKEEEEENDDDESEEESEEEEESEDEESEEEESEEEKAPPLFEEATYEMDDDDVLPLITRESCEEESSDGLLPLHCAAASGSAAVIQKMIAEYPEAASAMTDEGAVPLHIAVSCDRSVEILRILIVANPDALKVRIAPEEGEEPVIPKDLPDVSAATIAVLEAAESPDGLKRMQELVARSSDEPSSDGALSAESDVESDEEEGALDEGMAVIKSAVEAAGLDATDVLPKVKENGIENVEGLAKLSMKELKSKLGITVGNAKKLEKSIADAAKAVKAKAKADAEAPIRSALDDALVLRLEAHGLLVKVGAVLMREEITTLDDLTVEDMEATEEISHEDATKVLSPPEQPAAKMGKARSKSRGVSFGPDVTSAGDTGHLRKQLGQFRSVKETFDAKVGIDDDDEDEDITEAQRAVEQLFWNNVQEAETLYKEAVANKDPRAALVSLDKAISYVPRGSYILAAAKMHLTLGEPIKAIERCDQVSSAKSSVEHVKVDKLRKRAEKVAAEKAKSQTVAGDGGSGGGGGEKNDASTARRRRSVSAQIVIDGQQYTKIKLLAGSAEARAQIWLMKDKHTYQVVMKQCENETAATTEYEVRRALGWHEHGQRGILKMIAYEVRAAATPLGLLPLIIDPHAL